MTKEQQELYDSWDKKMIYEAYLSEHATRKRLNKEVNRLMRNMKELEWMLKGYLKPQVNG